MKLLILFFLSLIMTSFADEWSRKDEDFSFVPGELRFYNRSSCAKRALLPTKSAFLLVDNVNIAKSVFRLSKRLGIDSKSTTDLGIQKFRYSLATILQITAGKILKGELPLIPLKPSAEVSEYLLQCEKDNCAPLYQYLETNWLNSGKSLHASMSNCRVIKKFSTFQSNLKVSKPDKVLMEEMAKESLRSNEYFHQCNDFSDVTEPEVALYQFDINAGITFDKIGFDFWNTLKIYLSWAFRNAPEMEELAAPFDYLFKSANLEEMVLLFSNGCESIKPTSCSQNDLSLNNLSFLTHNAKDIDWNNLDMVKPVPEIEPNNLFAKPLPLTENDLLNLGNSENTDAWVSNFRDNYIHVRGYNKIKTTRALNSLRLITDNLSAEGMLKRLSKDASLLNGTKKQHLYYLCSEFSLAANKDLSLIKKDLWRLKDIKQLQNLIQSFNGDDFGQYWNFFEALAKEVNTYCKNLKQREIWDDSFELNKEGFAPWYRMLVYEKKFSFSDDPFISVPATDAPYLSLKTGESICADGIHCARQILDSLMSLSAVSLSLSTLTPENGAVVSNNMANPYASHLACGAYDPWQKKNQIVFNAIHDLVQTAVFGFLPTPVYVGASLDPKRVVSFQTLVKEGMVYYDPQFNTKRFKLTLMADLGPLVGVPCAVSISGSRLNPFNYYMFNGISVNTCRERARNETRVGEGGDSVTEESYRQVCAACAINLSSVASSASIINPAFRVSFFLIKGIVRLAQDVRDPHDLSKDWKVSPHQVSLSYRYHGKITKSCAGKLIKGKDCLPKSCEASVVSSLTKAYKMSPVRSDFSCVKGTGRIEIRECADPVYVNFNQFNPDEMQVQTNCTLKARKI